MHSPLARRTATATTVALLLLAGSVAPAVADAADAGPRAIAASAARDARILDITSTDKAMTAPATATPGPTTFRSTTTHEGSGWVGLARIGDGGALTYLGGAVVHPGRPGLFTQTLEPGQYLLFDYLHTLEGAQPREQRLTVSGSASGRAVRPSATIVSHDTGAGPRFEVRGTLRADRPFRFVNTLAGQYNEAVLFPLDKDVTRAELQEFFDALNDGASPTPPFDTSVGLGCLPLSPGRSADIQVPLGKGRHVLVTWVRDASGKLLAQQGQFEIVEVR
ncbi:hypothetical protein ABZ192_24805 [Streptomyces sp. NPDC006235]|uniref:hypothetical protein n=1 Tax=Streptomyces sp. NPDC006235 TaxID=3156736 RepID=UPI0033BC8731